MAKEFIIYLLPYFAVKLVLLRKVFKRSVILFALTESFCSLAFSNAD